MNTDKIYDHRTPESELLVLLDTGVLMERVNVLIALCNREIEDERTVVQKIYQRIYDPSARSRVIGIADERIFAIACLQAIDSDEATQIYKRIYGKLTKEDKEGLDYVVNADTIFRH